VVRYAAGEAAASHKVSINGAGATTLVYPKTATWGTFPAGQVVVIEAALRKGRNSIKFSKGDGFAELDRIDIVRKATSVLSLGAFDRSPNASYDSAHDGVVLGPSSSATYENVGLGDGSLKTLRLCAASGSGRVRIGLGSASVQDVDVAGAGCATHDLAASIQGAKGVHDLVLTRVNGTMTLTSIQFSSSPTSVVRAAVQRDIRDGIPHDLLGRATPADATPLRMDVLR
jgi:hypothetical protein